MPNYGHLSLSCAKIERPSPLEKPPCKVRFFTQNFSRKYRQKVTAASSTSNHFSSRFSTSCTNAPRLFSRVKAGTPSAFGEKSHTSAYTPKQGMFQMERCQYTRTIPHVSETLRSQGVERQTLPLLGLGWMHSRRTQKAFGTAMRLCASLFRRRRGPAGLRCPVAAARSARFSGIERLDQAFRQSYYHTQQPNGQLFGTCVGTALGGKMRAITLGFKESYHGRTLPYKRTDPRVFHGTFRAERSQATVEKYLRSVRGFSLFLDGRPVTKSVILEWKGFLRRRGYAPSTVNVSLAALNYLFNFLG